MASFTSVARVVELLLDDPILIQSWQQLAGSLGVRKADYVGEETRFRNGTAKIDEVFARIITAWSHNGRNRTNVCSIQSLCETLRSLKFNAAADKLEPTFDRASILAPASSCVAFQKACGVKQKWWQEKKPLINSFVERRLDGTLLVDKLKGMLTQTGKKAVISQQACISGLGGIGKTTLAKWFANSCEDDFDHIVWLDCGEDSLGSSFDRLWENIHNDHGKPEKHKPTMIADTARKCFKACGNCHILIIYDNAEGYTGKQGIHSTLPSHDQFPNIMCLITSRWTAWGSPAGHGVIPQLSLQTFSLEESVQFLERNLIGVNFKCQELEKLSELIGHLPLALQIALAHANKYYAKTEKGLASYIETLAKSTDSIVEQTTDVDGYNKGLLVILNESKAKVQESRPLAWSVLCKMAYLRCDFVGIRFLASVEAVDYDVVLEACHVLKDHSLVNITALEDEFAQNRIFPKDRNYISVHRLLQRSIYLLNVTEAVVHHSKILGSAHVNGDDIWYKWETYLAACELPGLSKEIAIAKKNIYEVLVLARFFKHGKCQEAERLLDVFKDVTEHLSDYFECPHKVSVLSRWWRSKFGCPPCSTTKWRNGLIINVLSAFLLHMQGRLAEALTCFEKSKAQAKTRHKLVVSLHDTQYSSDGLAQYIYSAPPHWEGLALQDLYVVMAMTLDELGRREDAVKVMEGVCITKDNTLTFQEWYGSKCKLDLIVPKDCSNLSLQGSMVDHASCVKWLNMYPCKTFTSYTVEGVKFVTEDGSFLEEIEYHEMFPLKSQNLQIDCRSEGSTNIVLEISKLWPNTTMLTLRGCIVTWGNEIYSQSNLEFLDMGDILNEIPKDLSLQQHFPKLQILYFRNTRPLETVVPIALFPPFLQWLELQAVNIVKVDNAATLPVVVNALHLNGYSPAEIWDIKQMFEFPRLYISYPLIDEKRLSQDCRYLCLILESSPDTMIYRKEWDSTILGELLVRLNGVDVHQDDDVIRIFRGKKQID